MGPITLCAELVLPAEYLRVTPPVPDRREEALQLNWRRGQLSLWFSDWEIRWNDPEEGDEIFESVMIAAQFTEYPRRLLELVDPSQAEWGGIVAWVSSSEHMEAYHAATAAQYQGPAQAHWETTRKELSATAKAATSRWLADEALGGFLRESAKELNAVVRRLFELLRIEYGQFAIPDPPRFTWRNVLLELPRDVVRSLSQEAVDEWLNTSQNRTAEVFARPLSLTEWPRIASALQAGWKPGLVDVLLANARTECDAAFGNPRLAVIEVITAGRVPLDVEK